MMPPGIPPNGSVAAPPPHDELLRVVGLRATLSGVRAVDGVSFAVPAGTIIGLIGPNGAGKSTTLKLIAGSLRPDSGQVRYAGRDITGRPVHEIALAGGKAFLHPVYIDDLVAALLLCERPQAAGRSYNIAGERPVIVRELASAIVHALCRELPAGSMPLWLANLPSDLFTLIPGMKGERAPLTRSRVQFLMHSRLYDISRATAELGYVPKVALEEGMKLTAAWYYKQQYLDNAPRKWRIV